MFGSCAIHWHDLINAERGQTLKAINNYFYVPVCWKDICLYMKCYARISFIVSGCFFWGTHVIFDAENMVSVFKHFGIDSTLINGGFMKSFYEDCKNIVCPLYCVNWKTCDVWECAHFSILANSSLSTNIYFFTSLHLPPRLSLLFSKINPESLQATSTGRMYLGLCLKGNEISVSSSGS